MPDQKPRTQPNTIVQYDNDFNKIDLSGFNMLELNLLYTALQLTKEKGLEEVSLSYMEIAQMAGIKKTNVKYIHETILSAKQKIFNLTISPYYFGQGNGSTLQRDVSIHVFDKWDLDPDRKTLTLGVSSRGLWVLNGLKYNFTSFELFEFVRLRSVTAKKLFKFIKQWKTLGKYQFNSIKELRTILDIPEKLQDNYIMARVIKPAIKEILEKTESFRGLTCSGIYDGKNHKLVGFTFTWTPEDTAQLPDRKLSISLQGQEEEEPAFTLQEQSLSRKSFRALAEEFGEEAVTRTINRIIERPYIGCLTEETVREWTKESLAYEEKQKSDGKESRNRFRNFDERTYDYEELEEKLFGRQ